MSESKLDSMVCVLAATRQPTRQSLIMKEVVRGSHPVLIETKLKEMTKGSVNFGLPDLRGEKHQ